MAIYPSLRGKRVFISGGASGIGAALVEAFATQGALVRFVDIDEDRAGQIASSLSQEGHDVSFENCDIRDTDALRDIVSQLLQRDGHFDVLVNNAGNDEAHPFPEVTPEYFDDRVRLNLRHQYFLAQMIAPGMAAVGRGAIINLGSVSWEIGARGVTVYTTLKSAIQGLTRSLARELGESGIRVNSISPGWVLTERQVEKGRNHPEKFAEYLSRQCIKEYLAAADVAEMALWLAADESARCTGHTYYVDAGVAA